MVNNQKDNKYKAIDIFVAHPDYTDKKIAEELGISNRTICNWRKDPEWVAALNLALREKFNGLQSLAIKSLEDSLISGGRNGLDAAKFVLQCSGYEPGEKVNVDTKGIDIKIDYGN